MLLMHRVLHTWHRQVDIHIALTPFSRDKLQEGGLSGHKIVVKNNFLDQDPGVGPGGGQFALFIGRLTEEKGVRTLLSAWEKIGARFPLKIIGGGPLANVVKEAAHHNPGVLQLGRVSDVELDRELGRATALMFPSEWYEGQPRTIIESYAKGTPVVASRLGSMATLVDHGRTGLHFRAGDPDDLAAKVEGLISNPAEAAGLRKGARSEFEARYTAAANYRDLLNIYERAQRLAVRGVESQDQVAAFRSSSLLR